MAAVGGFILSSCSKEPEVSFTADKTSAKMNESVTFTNGSAEKKAYNFEWSFGDGGSAATFNAAHAYTSPGAYTVTLTASNKKGNKFGTATAAITVSKEDANLSTDQNTYNNNQMAYDQKMKAIMNAMVGTWKVSAVSASATYCATSSSTTVVGNADALKSTITMNEGGKMTFADYNGNLDQGNWDLIDPTHVHLYNSFEFSYTNTSNSNLEDHFNIPSGVYVMTQSGATVTLSRLETTTTTTTTGTTTTNCDNTASYSLTLSK